MRFVVKISSDSFIKSRTVRDWHFKQLRRNVKKILQTIDGRVRVSIDSDRLEVLCGDSMAEACLQRMGDIAGIHSILTVDTFSLPEESDPFEFIAKKTVCYYADAIEGKSFAVRCRRVGKHDFKSVDVERKVGSFLLANSVNSTVKLKSPDVTVSIEIKHHKVYFVKDRKQGMSGFPVGTQDNVVSLISGGFDSSVASYKMMRKGCRVHYVFFNLGGTAHALGAQQAALFLWQKYGYSHKATFHTITLDTFVTQLMQLPSASLNGVILKRAMIKLAGMVANKLKTNILVTGESLAQVSSQTLANLSVIDRATDHLIVRPLITMDKREIIDTAEEIGSAIFAQNMVEYCGVISKKPSVAAPLNEVLEAEKALGDQWFYDALESAESTNVSDIIENLNQQPKVEFIAEPEGYVVIDIRATATPIDEADLHIHFYKLNQQFASLAQDKAYLLYCDKGVMSQLHAAYLHEQGFKNVKVFRPE